MNADGPAGDTRGDVDALAGNSSMRGRPTRAFSTSCPRRRVGRGAGVARELVTTLAGRGGVIEVEAIAKPGGLGPVLRDVALA
jgi:hypothetical protein